jgi:hypothetical protein
LFLHLYQKTLFLFFLYKNNTTVEQVMIKMILVQSLQVLNSPVEKKRLQNS